MGTDDLRHDGSTPDNLPDYVLQHLGQALRNRMRDTIFAPFPELIESLLLVLDKDEPKSEQGSGIAGRGCARGVE
jgi:hypothetical protein